MKTHLRNRSLLPALLGSLGLLILAGRVTAQTFTTLHSFTVTSPLEINSDGANPNDCLILSDNALYGTAYNGGSDGRGTVFMVNTDGAGFTNLHSFVINNGGIHPLAGLVLFGGSLYGTTLAGGSSGAGTVFAIKTDGTSYTSLHDFTGPGGDGQYPASALILSSNTLYGTTQGSGASAGSIFALNIDGTGFADLYDFSGGEGRSPTGSLCLSGTTLYGTTSYGGSSDAGTVFAINTDGTGFKTLHSFTGGSDGANPNANLVFSGSTLYGTASGGGSSGNGTVFAINTDGTGFTNLYNFSVGTGTFPNVTNSDGAGPGAGLILSNSTLYGTTLGGGSSGNGTVFAIHTTGTGFKLLHSFTTLSGSPGRNADGANPRGSLFLWANTLYGTATSGGSAGNGTVFGLSLGAVTPPQLAITSSGPDVILSWPTNFMGFTLQTTTNLVSLLWTTNLPVPVALNGNYTVTNPISDTQQFFRLGR